MFFSYLFFSQPEKHFRILILDLKTLETFCKANHEIR